ncbi:MAG: hypothetical protein H0X28_11635 [Solirubrobacterales bacterium]|nr:hypothetical protein [Solirubrobacterales bacterium]
MSEAELAIGGILVGAVASGGVQAVLARSDRRRAGRTAARLVYLQLINAHSAIEDLRVLRDWNMMITQWDEYAVLWERCGDALVQFLSTRRATRVATAYECLATLARTRMRDAQEPAPAHGQSPNFDPGAPLLERYAQVVERAKLISLRASFRWWEVKSRRALLAANAPENIAQLRAEQLGNQEPEQAQ